MSYPPPYGGEDEANRPTDTWGVEALCGLCLSARDLTLTLDGWRCRTGCALDHDPGVTILGF